MQPPGHPSTPRLVVPWLTGQHPSCSNQANVSWRLETFRIGVTSWTIMCVLGGALGWYDLRNRVEHGERWVSACRLEDLKAARLPDATHRGKGFVGLPNGLDPPERRIVCQSQQGAPHEAGRERTSCRRGIRGLQVWCALGGDLCIQYRDDEAHGSP